MQAANIHLQGITTHTGAPLDAAFKAVRTKTLLAVLTHVNPTHLIVEGFPLARRALSFELLPLLDAAKAAQIMTILSIRDIVIAKTKPERIADIAARLRTYFHHILIHGDPQLYPLVAHYPIIADIPHSYTGYVADDGSMIPAAQSENHSRRQDPDAPVVVSSGGGAAGGHLFTHLAHLASRACLPAGLHGRVWHFLTGSHFPDTARARLQAIAAACPPDRRIIVEPARKDFRTLLQSAHLSVSQSGYNTVTDILGTRTPALLIPFAAGGREKEQSLRAHLLQQRQICAVVPEEDLTLPRWEAAYQRLWRDWPQQYPRFDLDGGRKTANIVKNLHV